MANVETKKAEMSSQFTVPTKITYNKIEKLVETTHLGQTCLKGPVLRQALKMKLRQNDVLNTVLKKTNDFKASC